ncbi:hypothetical protein F4859DRAFT_491937 [Xylaria cf. heliscus]|nr:hypothetical protein F4859DRAFT_491937 [Xylaria cf. heliscus]
MDGPATNSDTGNNPSSTVRYSQQDKDIGEAKSFPWEHPIPRNAFWDGLPYTVASNFLNAFTAEELRAISIDPDSAQSKEGKLRFLATWLGKKSAKQEELGPLNDAAWERLMLASVSVRRELGDLAGAEEIARLLVERRKDGNLQHLHLLAGILLDRGQYAEAESTERKVEPWLVEKLGKDSPQALSATRIIIQALWKQGPTRHAEAQNLLEKSQSIVNGMESGKYTVYQDEERELLKELISQMH